tara:strand:+ start:659 stop:1069 length:411 start_codon:yes stop_codon:yes gene_type:complete
MKRFLPIIFLTIMFMGLLTSRYSFAHHGWSYYKDDFRLTLIVTELKLRNPHDQIIGMDSDGRTWNLVLAPPARNRRYGFDENTILVDQEIHIFGRKHPEKLEIKVHCLYKGDSLVYTYRYYFGRTSLQRYGGQQDC